MVQEALERAEHGQMLYYYVYLLFQLVYDGSTLYYYVNPFLQEVQEALERAQQ